MTVEIKFANEKLLNEFFGSETKKPTMHALVAVEDGRVALVAGLFHMAPKTVILFSDTKPGWIAAHPLSAVKMTKRLLSFADKQGWKVQSFPDETISKSKSYLEHFGFVEQSNGYERQRP